MGYLKPIESHFQAVDRKGDIKMKSEDFAAKKMLEETHRADHLSDRERQLIGLAVSVTRGCIACSGSRRHLLGRISDAGSEWTLSTARRTRHTC